MNAPRPRYDRPKSDREDAPDRGLAAGVHRRRSALTALLALVAFTALAAFAALLSTGATAEAVDTRGVATEPTIAKQADSACKDGFQHVYAAFYGWSTSGGHIVYSGEEARPQGTQFQTDRIVGFWGLEFRDMCVSNDGSRAYQLHRLSSACEKAQLPAAVCTSVSAERRAELEAWRARATRASGKPLHEWSPPGGWEYHISGQAERERLRLEDWTPEQRRIPRN